MKSRCPSSVTSSLLQHPCWPTKASHAPERLRLMERALSTDIAGPGFTRPRPLSLWRLFAIELPGNSFAPRPALALEDFAHPPGIDIEDSSNPVLELSVPEPAPDL